MKALKSISALALAVVTSATLGLNAAAEVSSYNWKAVKETYYSAPTSVGSYPDSANFYYSPNGYTTHLGSIDNSDLISTGTLTVSCSCSYANMSSFVMTQIGDKEHKVTLTGAVTYGIPFTYTAFTNTPGNTYTAKGITKLL